MSKGFLVLAQNTKEVNYLEQAYCLALSIKHSQPTIKNISLVTNDTVPKKYLKAFDQIIPIPWVDKTDTSRYAGEHRWKLFHVSPYDETMVLDADMLVLEDVTKWWEQCANYDINFCSIVKNHKLEIVSSDFYRKAFTENNLSNPYFGLHYFKKSQAALEFYKVLEFVCNNWEWCYDQFAPAHYQDWLSMDLATAISIEISGLQLIDVCSPLEFIHMKPRVQNWESTPISWQDGVSYVLTAKGDLVVGNIKQSKIFHYVEKNFITNRIVTTLEELANGQEKPV